MTVIKRIIDILSISYRTMATEILLNKLNTTKACYDPTYYEQIHKNHAILQKIANDYPKIKDSDSFKWYIYMNKKIEYVREFSKKNFEKSLDISVALYSEAPNEKIKRASVPSVLDSLMELKINLDPTIYSQKYKQLEDVFKALAINIVNDPISQKEDSKTILYSGLGTALAYNAYLNENSEESLFYIKKQFDKYGAERFFKEESSNSQP